MSNTLPSWTSVELDPKEITLVNEFLTQFGFTEQLETESNSIVATTGLWRSCGSFSGITRCIDLPSSCSSLIADENESVPTDVITQQEEVRSILGNIQLKTFNDEIEVDGEIRDMPLMDKVLLIVNDIGANYVLSRVHHRCQIAVVFVYNVITDNEQEWNDYQKVRRISIEQILPRIQSFYARWLRYRTGYFSVDIFNQNLNTILDRSSIDTNGSYVFSQVLLDILLGIKSDPIKDRNEFTEECAKEYIDRKEEFKALQSFNNDYKAKDALNWYTKPIFLHFQLNKALRMQNIHLLFLYRFFIRDIRAQLIENQCQSSIKVYRGQRMFKHELKQLKKYIHHKISINSLLSTSLNPQMALFYLCEPQTNVITNSNNVSTVSTEQNDTTISVSNKIWPVDEDDPDTVLTGEVSVLFEIDADPHHGIKEKRPFADISPFSEFEEEEQEILFMLGTVFRIEEIKEEKNDLWIIKLSLCDDEAEHDIESLLNYLKDDYENSSKDGIAGTITLCSFLLDMGKLDMTERLISRTLKELSSNDILNKAICYYQLGNVALHRNQYDIAQNLLKKVLKLLPKDHRLIANTYISIGNVQRYEKHFSRAMKSYNTALTIWKENIKEDQLLVATCYASIGSWYRIKRDFQNALEYYQKALAIREKYISIPHFTIGNLHVKLAQIYLDRNQAKLAFPHYVKALEICSKCLPHDHPLLSKAYYIAAITHQNFDTGRKTIDFFDKACVTDYRNSSLPQKWNPL
ncbi:unnamed protein product, partial [Rotaria sordida]